MPESLRLQMNRSEMQMQIHWRRTMTVLFVLPLVLSIFCEAAEPRRQWTVYLAQDKHLDYNWCGSTEEIESRMFNHFNGVFC